MCSVTNGLIIIVYEFNQLLVLSPYVFYLISDVVLRWWNRLQVKGQRIRILYIGIYIYRYIYGVSEYTVWMLPEYYQKSRAGALRARAGYCFLFKLSSDLNDFSSVKGNKKWRGCFFSLLDDHKCLIKNRQDKEKRKNNRRVQTRKILPEIRLLFSRLKKNVKNGTFLVVNHFNDATFNFEINNFMKKWFENVRRLKIWAFNLRLNIKW